MPCMLLNLVVAQGQAIISGRVTDASTNRPMPFATVYINETTRGTTANGDGEYQLTGIRAGNVEIVASSVGYTTLQQVIRVASGQNRRVSFALAPDPNALATVTITGKRSAAYNRLLRTFKRELLGDTPFADKCEISNENTLVLTEKEGRLEAQAREPLVIENKSLGYRLHYNLLHFDSFRRVAHYAGTSRFEILTPENTEQATRWERNRKKAYQGSMRHLIASLIARTYEREGFLVYTSKIDIADNASPLFQFGGNQPTDSVQPDSVLKAAQLPSERRFFSAKPLEIFYTWNRSVSSPYKDMPYAYSIVYMPKGKAAIVTTDGWISQPNGLEVRGVMSEDRLATLLPIDWQPTEQPAELLTRIPDEGVVLPPDSLAGLLANQWTDRQKNTAPAVFLHLDKPLYSTGDQLWFSGYLLNPTTHQVFAQPNATHQDAFHLELIGPGGQLLYHQWVQVKEGRAAGSFRLSDSLATGQYRIRAYTEMDARNSRPAFDRPLPIVNAVHVEASLPGLPPPTDSIDIQFLPEGGHWVVGLESRMGIKAINKKGQGIAVSGRIVASPGGDMGAFSTNRQGIGSIVLTPKINQTYTAQLQPPTVPIAFPLPLPDLNGLVLAADLVTDSTQLVVRIQASASWTQPFVYLAVQSRGQLVQQLKIQLLNGKARLSIPTAKLVAGVLQVTLFDGQGVPRAERLVFVPDQLLPIRTDVITTKPTYVAREPVVFSLHIADGFNEPLMMTGSAAITDAGQLPADTTVADIRTHLLLTGDLRGRVDKPNYYLSSQHRTVRRALDDLLLTQGWRRLNWQAKTNKPAPVDSLVNGIVLRGRVLDKKNMAVPDANILFTFNSRIGESFSRSARTDQAGRFQLDDLLLIDTITLQTRIMTMAFKSLPNTHMVLDKPSLEFVATDSTARFDRDGVKPFIAAMRQRQADDPNQYRDKNARQLKEVIVRATRPTDDQAVRKGSLHGDADGVIEFDDKSRTYANVYEMLSGRVAGVQVVIDSNGKYSVLIRGVGSFSKENMSPLYIVDGSYADENILLTLNPNQIARIEVIKNGGGSIYGARGGSGTIAFYTKKGGNKTKPNPDEVPLTLYGYPAKREFYTPKYDSPADSIPDRTDRRDVLFWRPLFNTDSHGVTTFNFPLSDIARTLRLSVQGVTSSGRPVVINRLINMR